jgi:hypothetical protein
MTTQAELFEDQEGQALVQAILARKALAQAKPLYRTYSMAVLWNLDPVNLNYARWMGTEHDNALPVDGDAMARRAAELHRCTTGINAAWSKARLLNATQQDAVPGHDRDAYRKHQEETK